VKKEVIYRSDIYFTPLKSQTEIDAAEIKKIIKKEYGKAQIKPEDLKTGAVIITGETARKTNANSVLTALSDMAGDFVVATAGPDLESVLSAKGAGADRISEEEREVIANADIGGGTSNIALYEKGVLKGTSCLDIGGRLIRVEQEHISYIYPAVKTLAANHGISIQVGDRADIQKLYKVCEYMALQLAMALHVTEQDEYHKRLYTNQGNPLPSQPSVCGVTYSGGVADCIGKEEPEHVFCYGDIGVLLGRAIKNCTHLKKLKTYLAAETIRATVVGAGTHTTNVSGSTISYAKDKLPVKNIPVLKIPSQEEAESAAFQREVSAQLNLYKTEGALSQMAIAFSGNYHTSFQQIQELARTIAEGAKEIIDSPYPLILVIENDIAKVLGNALNVLLELKKEVICIDGIYVHKGDYIDIGNPVAEGRVVPVVIKTLVFNT
jgi:ethanolamine utilization protein EutA